MVFVCSSFVLVLVGVESDDFRCCIGRFCCVRSGVC